LLKNSTEKGFLYVWACCKSEEWAVRMKFRRRARITPGADKSYQHEQFLRALRSAADQAACG
jgi:hypothetical protein